MIKPIPPFRPGDRVTNPAGAIATVIAVIPGEAGDWLAIRYDGAPNLVYRPADQFNHLQVHQSKAA